MGNHLNRDSPRLGDANAFRLNSVLPQLDSNLIRLLVRLAKTKQAHPIKLREELNLIETAARSKFI